MCMKKLLIALLFTGIVSPAVVLAGGIVTNANQSTAYVRMLARDASTSIDAVYYNPAGLTKLADGFHLSLNNQSLFQKKTIENTLIYLNEHKYVGDVTVPLYPDIYAAYKKGKFALGFGFTPSAGGGSAKYDTGLPSFELGYATTPYSLSKAAGNVNFCTEYSADIAFEGSSVFWGAQLNAAYELSSVISVSAGVRMVLAKNTYKGHIKDVMINPQHPALNPSGGMMRAETFFASANPPKAPLFSDQEVDAEQKGTGYTPIIGANLTFGEKLNIGIKYEFKTKLELENNTKKDMVQPQFVDGARIRSDVPAILSIGIGYSLMPKMRVSTGLHYYFDKDATIEKAPGVKKDIDGNLYEIALGGEYDITDKVLISAGYLYAKTGVGQGYQTDLSHSLTSSTVGFGGAFKVNEKMTLNLGMLYTMYSSDAKTSSYQVLTGTPIQEDISYKETYNRTNLGFSIGVDYHF